MAQKQSNPRGMGAESVKPGEIIPSEVKQPITKPPLQRDEARSEAKDISGNPGAPGASLIPPKSSPSPHPGQGGPHPGQGGPHPGQGGLRARAAAGQADASSQPQGPRAVPLRRAPARGQVAANDDMPTIGGLIFALQQRPSKSPFIIALAASVIWFALGCLIAWAVIKQTPAEITGFSALLSTPSVAAVIALIAVPIALFWFLGILAWRAQELRLMSSAMTEVAVRLAEPDKMAEQSVASLGQTVRRQVAAMNDAISRALGRAGELEALVHNEVAALERSYSENENRIRNLIHELASEREALANNSERVSEALRGVGSQVSRELAAASEKASQSLSQASASMADTLVSRGHKITSAVTAAGAAIDEKLAERGARITEQLAKHGSQAAEALRQSTLEVTKAIQETSDRTAAAISAKGNNLVSSVMSMSEKVGREIPVLLDRLGGEQSRLSGIIESATKNLSALETALADRTSALDGSIADRTKVLQTVLDEQSRVIDTSLAERTQALETILSRRAQSFDAALAERTRTLDASISRHAGGIRDTLDQHSKSMEKTLSRQAASIEHVVASSSQSIQRSVTELAVRSGASSETMVSQAHVLKEVSGTLLTQIHGLTKRFEDQGSVIMNSARALEVANTRVDTVMEARQASLSKLLDNINGRAVELDRMMHNYSNMLEQSLSKAEARARKVSETLAKDSAEKSQAAIREIDRLRSDAQSHTARAVTELQSSFSSLSDQVAQQLTTLSSKFSETTRHVKDTTHKAASELESTQSELIRQAKALPETTKQSATAVRKALQDQLSALDTLSDLATRHSYASQVARPDSPVDAGAPGNGRRDGGFANLPATGKEQYAKPQGFAGDHPGGRRGGDETAPFMRGPGFLQNDRPDAAQHGFAGQWPGASDNLDAVTAGLIHQRIESPKPAQPPAFPAHAESGGNRGQWSLGDLLARASEPEDSFAGPDHSYGAPPIVQPLDHAKHGDPKARPDHPPASLDLREWANAIDYGTAIDVWQRYNRGERDVLNRDLYNRQGQIAFDQVKRQYQYDHTFRHIVDRYMADFERLLKDVSTSDPHGRTVQNHLISETGRVYLLLAHASGRLG